MKLVKKKICFSTIYYTFIDKNGDKVENRIKTLEIQSNKVTHDNALKVLESCIDIQRGLIPVILKIEHTEKIFQCTLEDFLKIASERKED